jgi:hypothetical protein
VEAGKKQRQREDRPREFDSARLSPVWFGYVAFERDSRL